MVNAEADDFLKTMESLYASVLNNEESFPRSGCADISLSIVGSERMRN